MPATPPRPVASLQGTLRIATVRVADWPAAVHWYGQVLGLPQRFADAASQYAMFDAGGVRLAVEGAGRPAFPRGEGAGATLLNFEVADLGSALQGLQARGGCARTDILQGPGYGFVAVADPEGNEHVIYQRTSGGKPC